VHSGNIKEWLGIKEARLLGTRPAVRRPASHLKASHLGVLRLPLAAAHRLAFGPCRQAFPRACRRGCPLLAFHPVLGEAASIRPGSHLVELLQAAFRHHPWDAVRETLRSWRINLDRIWKIFLCILEFFCEGQSTLNSSAHFLLRP
jgi:hypothetical protein